MRAEQNNDQGRQHKYSNQNQAHSWLLFGLTYLTANETIAFLKVGAQSGGTSRSPINVRCQPAHRQLLEVASGSLSRKNGRALKRGHRLLGVSLRFTGDIAEGRRHYDQAIALYDPDEHRPLATRFAQDVRVAILTYRASALWLLGFPKAALSNADDALRDAREIGHAGTLMHALVFTSLTHIFCREYAAASVPSDELAAFADEKDALFWRALAMMIRGLLLVMTGRASDAVQMITSGITARRPTGTTLLTPLWLCSLTRAYAELCQFDDAWRCIGEAMTGMEMTKEIWWEAEVYRTAGEIALLSPRPDAAKAEAYFRNRGPTGTWREFLTRHASDIWAFRLFLRPDRPVTDASRLLSDQASGRGTARKCLILSVVEADRDDQKGKIGCNSSTWWWTCRHPSRESPG